MTRTTIATGKPDNPDDKRREHGNAIDIDPEALTAPSPGQTDDDGDDDDDGNDVQDVTHGETDAAPVQQVSGHEPLNPDFAVFTETDEEGREMNSARIENGLMKEAADHFGDLVYFIAELWIDADHYTAHVPRTIRQLAKRENRTRNDVRQLLDGLKADGWIKSYDARGIQLPHRIHADGRAIIGRNRKTH